LIVLKSDWNFAFKRRIRFMHVYIQFLCGMPPRKALFCAEKSHVKGNRNEQCKLGLMV
jgi:hypothetical protein